MAGIRETVPLMAPADRLSALDAAFLDLDHADAPLHVGVTLRLDGPAPTLAGLRRHLDGRMDRAPRLRQRILTAPGGDALWADDPGFDVARHVHAVALPPSDDPDGALAELAGVLLSTPLPPGRPLWCMYLVREPGPGWSLIAQIHHVLLDGMAGMTLAGLLLDVEPEPTAPGPRAAWRPQPPPSGAGAAARGITGRAGAGARTVIGASTDGLGPLRQAGELVRHTMVTTGAITNRIDRLESRDLVRREADPVDRRGVRVVLTDAGRRAVDATSTASNSRYR